MTFGSLFAGIGGFDLGLERAGMTCKWQVEIDPFCRKVLTKHWPDVPKFEDVRTVGAHNLERVDLICGGFPCQDISSNNQYKRGLIGAKSGLFHQAIRVADELRPSCLLLENVSDLLVRGMGTVLGELAAIGYDAEWLSLPAAIFRLPQRRWRVFIVAYPGSGGCETGDERISSRSLALLWSDGDRLASAEHAASKSAARVCGMDDGFPDRMDRVAAVGNAVAPDVAEWIGRRLMESVA